MIQCKIEDLELNEEMDQKAAELIIGGYYCGGRRPIYGYRRRRVMRTRIIRQRYYTWTTQRVIVGWRGGFCRPRPYRGYRGYRRRC